MIRPVLLTVLGTTLFLILYTHFLYPVVLSVAASRRSAPEHHSGTEYRPAVTMIVPAYNEADCIGDKVENVRQLEYDGPFECIVVSDSDDETDAIVREEGGDLIDLISFDERIGKSSAINAGLERATGDVIVLSDANTMYEAESLGALVEPLADPSVGCTTGRLELRDRDGSTAEGLYWRYELAIRRLEAKFGTTVSINGGMVALRASEIELLPPEIVNDDMYIALRCLTRGQRVVYTPDATAWEYTTGDVFTEFARRVRIGAGNYQLLLHCPGALDPRHGIAWLQYVSHKVLRWIAPYLLAMSLGAAAVLAYQGDPVGRWVAFPAGICIVLGAIGAVSERLRDRTLFRVPAFYLLMNAALFVGSLRATRGTTLDVWQSTR